jgi:glutathione S-transferase
MGMPDADIYPSATGLASHVVKAHENADAEHVLYSGWFCVCNVFKSCTYIH